ncbi:MAG: helix-turn-helix transcriptional regulator [Clostridia bacterium]|nr:helix-turn-helix transcriptional regulator [Clostridia bacterium]
MIGERLKELRNDHHDTQQALADKMNVSVSTIQSWEQGKSAPSHELLVALCRLYQVSSDFLLGLKDDDPIFSARRMELSPENLLLLRRFEAFLLSEQKKTLRGKQKSVSPCG